MQTQPPLSTIEVLLNNSEGLADCFATGDFQIANFLFNQNQYRLQVSIDAVGYQVIPKAGQSGWSFYFLLGVPNDSNSWKIYVASPTKTAFIDASITETDFAENGFYNYLFINESNGFDSGYRLPVLPSDSLRVGATKESLNVVVDLNQEQVFRVALVDSENNIVNSNIGRVEFNSVDTTKILKATITTPLSRPELATKYINNKSTCDLPVKFAYCLVNGSQFGDIASGMVVSDINSILNVIFAGYQFTVSASTNVFGFEQFDLEIPYSELGLEDIELALCAPKFEIVICPDFRSDEQIQFDDPVFFVDSSPSTFNVQQSGIFANTFQVFSFNPIWDWTDGLGGERRSLISYLTTDELTTWCMQMVFTRNGQITNFKPALLAGYVYNPDNDSSEFALAGNGITYQDYEAIENGDSWVFGFTLNASISETTGPMVANRQNQSVPTDNWVAGEIWPDGLLAQDRKKYLGAIQYGLLDIDTGGSALESVIAWEVDKDYQEFQLIPPSIFKPMIFEGVKLHAGFDQVGYLMDVQVTGCDSCYPYAFVYADIPFSVQPGCYRLVVYLDENAIVPLAISDVFEYLDKGETSKIIEFSDDQGAFGFKYDQGQSQKLRLNLFIGSPENLVSETVYRQSNGVHRFGQVAIDKQLTVNTLWQPEKFHEAFYFAVKHQTLKIDQKNYICTSEYATENPLDNSSSEGYNELSVGEFKVVKQGFAPLKNLPQKCN